MGSRPVRPPVAGVGLGNVIYLRTVRDALALREMASVEKTVMVVGGGLLACEVAASLRQMKLKVSVMHRSDYLFNRYVDRETGTWLTDYFAKHGVTMLMGESLNGFEGKTVLRNIQTKSGNRVPAGLAVVATGAEPNLDLVRNTPLAGPHGSPVSDYLETEEKGIYAIGDLAFYPDRLMGGMRRQTHWDNARDQGLIAGANMTGKKRIRYEQLPYFWTEMFDLRMDFVGDFSVPPTRIELRGTHAKRKFVARYYHGEKLRAILLCQQPPRDEEGIAPRGGEITAGAALSRHPMNSATVTDRRYRNQRALPLSIFQGKSAGSCKFGLLTRTSFQSQGLAERRRHSNSNGVDNGLTCSLTASMTSFGSPSIFILAVQ